MPVEVPVGNAVLHGHHDRFRGEQLGYVVRDGFHLVRFHRQDHHVLRAGGSVIVGRLHAIRNVLGAVAHDEFHSVLADRVQIRTTDDEGDVFTGQSQFHADVATDGAGANDCNLHRSIPL